MHGRLSPLDARLSRMHRALMPQVLELVGHVLPSALADLALAMASACTVDTDNNNNNTEDDDDNIGGDTDDNIDCDTAEDDDNDDEGGRQTDGRAEPVAALDGNQNSDAANNNARGGDGSDGSGVSPVAEVPLVPDRDAAGPEEERQLLLFRMVGTVDPDTTYLNAGFRSLHVGGGDPASPEREEEEEEEGRGSGVMVNSTGEEVGRRGSAAGTTSSYCKETRARLLTSLLPSASAGEERRGRRQRRQRRRNRSVVFDVCSIDPGGLTTDYVS